MTTETVQPTTSEEQWATITITSVERKTSRRGKAFLDIKDEHGDYWDCWLEELFSPLQEGAHLEIKYVKRQGFHDIVGIKGFMENPKASSKSPYAKRSFTDEWKLHSLTSRAGIAKSLIEAGIWKPTPDEAWDWVVRGLI